MSGFKVFGNSYGDYFVGLSLADVQDWLIEEQDYHPDDLEPLEDWYEVEDWQTSKDYVYDSLTGLRYTVPDFINGVVSRSSTLPLRLSIDLGN